MIGSEKAGDRTVYTIDVTPKRREKYLFRGRIWVDGEDYALVEKNALYRCLDKLLPHKACLRKEWAVLVSAHHRKRHRRTALWDNGFDD